jgi:S1-C subfamily serine protease
MNEDVEAPTPDPTRGLHTHEVTSASPSIWRPPASGTDATHTLNAEHPPIEDTTVTAYSPPPPPPPTPRSTGDEGPRRGRRASILAGALAGALVAAGVSAAMTTALDKNDSTPTTSVAAAALTPVSLTSGTAGTSGISVSDLVKRIGPSVVRVKVDITQNTPFGTRSGTGEGTGVILSSDGELLTNAHVVDSATNVTVTTSDGKNHPAKVLGVDPDDDIAVVKITDSGRFSPAKLGASATAIVGEPVVAVGNALGLDGAPTVTTGIVSALNRSLDDATSSLHGLIQTDAAINHGNSGGPLLNSRGEVIGINTAIAADATNIGFSIAIDNVKPLIAKLEKGESVTSDKTYLGISTQTVSDDVRTQLGLKVDTGAVIGEVVANTPAQRAGLKPNDVVTKANGTDITSAQQLTSIVHHLSPGDHLKLTVNRDGSTMTIDATLGTRGAVPA